MTLGAGDGRAEVQSSALPDRPWVESDQLEAHLAATEATPAHAEAARALARDGVTVLDLADPNAAALCDAAVAELSHIWTDKSVKRVHDAWRISPAVRALALSDEIRAFLRLAYGREPFPFQTINFELGSQQSAHSDTIHFHSDPERFMCGVWIALEDVEEDAGPLVYYPGSHRAPVLSMRDVGVNSPKPTHAHYERFYPPAVKRQIASLGLERRIALLKKGQAFVWTANLIHGGSRIERPGATRRSLVVHYYFEGCAYFTPMRSDVEAGRLHLRLPSDVRTGGWRWPTRTGRPLTPGWRTVLYALRQRVLGRPAVIRDRG
jgi:hypothetical protein